MHAAAKTKARPRHNFIALPSQASVQPITSRSTALGTFHVQESVWILGLRGVGVFGRSGRLDVNGSVCLVEKHVERCQALFGA